MARLSRNLAAPDPLPGVAGAFVKDIPLGLLEEMRDFEDTSPVEQVLWVGKNLLVDENGDPFEDLISEDEIRGLGRTFVADLMKAITAYLQSQSASAEGNGDDSDGE